MDELNELLEYVELMQSICAKRWGAGVEIQERMFEMGMTIAYGVVANKIRTMIEMGKEEEKELEAFYGG